MHKKTLPNGQGIKVFLIYHVRHLVYLRAEDLYGITRNFHLRCMPASTTYFDSSQPVLHASSFCIAVRDCSIPSSFFSALHSVQLVGTLSLSLLGYATRYCGCIYASITPCSSVLQVSMQGYTCCPLQYLCWFSERDFQPCLLRWHFSYAQYLYSLLRLDELRWVATIKLVCYPLSVQRMLRLTYLFYCGPENFLDIQVV